MVLESLIRPISKKRRKSIDPVKAIPKVVPKHDTPQRDSCHSFSSAIRLDVYNLYMIDPNSLVFSQMVTKKAIVGVQTQISNFNAIQSASTVLIQHPADNMVEEEIIYKPQSDRCKPLVTPVSTLDFDNSLYQNTTGAPQVLWKKGS